MSDRGPISIGWEVYGVDSLIQRLTTLGTIVELAMQLKAQDWMERLVDIIANQKLDGQVLNRKTGRLAASVHGEVEAADGNVSINIEAGEGLPYARIHEFGGIINHPGGTAYVGVGGGVARWISNLVAAKMGELPRTVPHKIPMPQRSYMYSTLEENEQKVLDDFRQIILDATT